jgi:hypothetical protein
MQFFKLFTNIVVELRRLRIEEVHEVIDFRAECRLSCRLAFLAKKKKFLKRCALHFFSQS